MEKPYLYLPLDDYADSYASAVLSNSPLDYWKFNELSGTVATDYIGSKPGTIGSGITLGSAGIQGTGFTFPGTTAGPIVTFAGASVPNDFSLEAWVNGTIASTGTAFPGIIGLMTADQSSFIQIDVTPGPPVTLRARIDTPTALNQVLSTSTTVGNSAWHQVVLTFARSTGVANLYMDGALLQTLTISGTLATSFSNGSIGGGLKGTAYTVSGTVDQPAIYQSALTLNQVLEHYQAGTAALAATKDLSGNGFNGTYSSSFASSYNPLVAQGATSTSKNLIDANNSSFETSVGSWTNFSNASFSQDSGWAAVGSNSLRVTAVATGDVYAALGYNNTLFAVTPGNLLTITLTVNENLAHTLLLYAVFNNSSGAWITSTIVYNSVTTLNGVSVITGSVVIPPNVSYAGLIVRSQVMTAAQYFNIDNVIMTTSSLPAVTQSFSGARKVTGTMPVGLWSKSAPTQPFTIDGWVYASTLTQPQLIFGRSASEGIFLAPGVATFQVVTTAGTELISVPLNSTNQVFKITGIYDGSDIIIYINDEFAGSTTLQGTFTNTSTAIQIGGTAATSDVTYISHVSVFLRSLSGTQIYNQYSDGINTTYSDQIYRSGGLFFLLDDTESAIAWDLTENTFQEFNSNVILDTNLIWQDGFLRAIPDINNLLPAAWVTGVGWVIGSVGGTETATETLNQPDPIGGNNAFSIAYGTGTAGVDEYFATPAALTSTTLQPFTKYTFSMQVKSTAGSVPFHFSIEDFSDTGSSGEGYKASTATTSWQTFTNTFTTGAIPNIRFEVYNMLNEADGKTLVCYNPVLQLNSAVVDSAAPAYGQRISQYDIGEFGTIDGSRIDWDSSSAYLKIEVSLDGGTTWTTCTNHATIPGLSATTVVTDKVIQFRQTFTDLFGSNADVPMLSRMRAVLYSRKDPISSSNVAQSTIVEPFTLAEAANDPIIANQAGYCTIGSGGSLTIPADVDSNTLAAAEFVIRNDGGSGNFFTAGSQTFNWTGAYSGLSAVYINGVRKIPNLSDFPVGIWVHVYIEFATPVVTSAVFTQCSLIMPALYWNKLVGTTMINHARAAFGTPSIYVIDPVPASFNEISTTGYQFVWDTG